jgi:pyruvate dehydrogenase E2 component (dihydrolipoamide acetyltransferase)
MPYEVLLPQWGMGMNDGLVLKWLKAEGDKVSKGDSLVEIESSKVNAEVEAAEEGILARIVVPEGMVVDTGSVLAVILAEGEEADLPEPLSAGTPAAAAPAAPAASAAPAAASGGSGGGRQQVTPIARRVAKELGVDVSTVTGTGPRGRVTEEDVRKAAAGGGASATPAATPAAPYSGPPAKEVEKLSGLRATIARRMTESGQIPVVTLTTEVDVTAAQSMVEQLVRDWRRERIRPQFQDIVIKVVARALSEHPRANAHFNVDEVRMIESVNVGFAMAVKDGLVVPVVHDADKKSALEIAKAVRDVAKRVRDNSVDVDDYSGGTFSVTNLGHYGIDAFNPLLNPPEVGILGLGRIVEKPAIVAGEVTARSMMWLGLTFDHRAWDGAPAGDFLQAVSRYLTDPGWITE